MKRAERASAFVTESKDRFSRPASSNISGELWLDASLGKHSSHSGGFTSGSAESTDQCGIDRQLSTSATISRRRASGPAWCDRCGQKRSPQRTSSCQ